MVYGTTHTALTIYMKYSQLNDIREIQLLEKQFISREQRGQWNMVRAYG